MNTLKSHLQTRAVSSPILHTGMLSLSKSLLCCVLLQVRAAGGLSDSAAARLRSQDLWPAAGQSNRQALELRKACQLNTSMCLLQLQRWGEVVPECNAVISVEPQNRKALYRRGQALHALGRCRLECLSCMFGLAWRVLHSPSAVLLWCCCSLTLICLQGAGWAVGWQPQPKLHLVVACARLSICCLGAFLHDRTSQLGRSAGEAA